MTSIAGEAIAQRVHQRWKSIDHPHPAEKTIGSSTLTSQDIRDIITKFADWLHRGIWEDKKEGPRGKPMNEYAFSGDLVCDGTYPEVDGWIAREFRVEVSLDTHPEWTMSGHPDGAGYFDADGEPCEWVDDDAYIWFAEGKLHGDATPWDREKARRQVLLNLAIAWHQAKNTDTTVFPKSRWGGVPFQWHRSARLGGGNIGIVSSTGPNTSISFDADEQTLEGILSFYARKAAIAIEAAEKDDVEWGVQKWKEEGGGSEMTMDIGYLNDPGGTLEEIVAMHQEAADRERQAKADKKAAESRLETALRECGAWERAHEEKMPISNFTLKYVQSKNTRGDVKALRQDGLTQYIKQTEYEYPNIKPRGNTEG